MSLRQVVLFVVIAGLVLAASPVRASADSPAAVAESIRSGLFSAERDLLVGSKNSEDWLSHAEKAYSGEFSAAIALADPATGQRISLGFAAMRQALQNEDPAAFAAARSQTWTAILAGSYAIVAEAIQTEQLPLARAWLLVREFRTASRFTRANADATRALHDLTNGEMDAATALQFLRADLFDTYQARLDEALRDLGTAHANNFAVRRGELAALAQGYFIILSPAYAEQRGGQALSSARAVFADLVTAALAGHSIEDPLASAKSALVDFRAAPLSPEEEARRAGQLLRYVNLIAVEYGRGVTGGRITKQFEIQEAVTFHEASLAAFADLRGLLAKIDLVATQEAEVLLESIGTDLRSTNAGDAVASPGDLRAAADELLKTLEALMPAQWKQNNTAGDFDVIASMLDQMESALRAGDYAAAESARLEAYAIMESGPEARLMTIDPNLKIRVEELFWNGGAQMAGLNSLLTQRASLQHVRMTRAALDVELHAVQKLLSTQSAPAAIVGNSAVIVFREGLEAVLILASLMGSLKLGQNQNYRRPLWLGTGLALLATLFTWSLARNVLVALARYGEKLEAIVSLLAIAVLLFVTNWFFHKSYWENWLASFHGRKKRLLAGEAGIWLGLVSLGFTSVYREGFESVLFLQALVLDGGTTQVFAGIAIGLTLTAVVGVLTFRMQSRLPQKKMLIATGLLISAVLLVMVGKTTHVFQLIGWLPATLLGGLTFPYWLGTWFGLYPTWEGLAFQLLAAVVVIGSYVLAEGLKKRQRRQDAILRVT